MINSKELQNRISWLLELSTPTLQKLVEMCTGNSTIDAKECCSILLKNDAIFDGDSFREELMKAVMAVDHLFKLQSDETFSKRCEMFLNEKIAFKEFPYCKTWKQVWQYVDKSLTILNKFLKKNNKIDEDFAADRKMWQRMVLTLDSSALKPFFKTEFDDDFKPSAEKENIMKLWTFEDLEELVKADNASIINLFRVELFKKEGKTLHFVAVQYNAKNVMKVLIRQGFDTDMSYANKDLFHYAAELGHLEILKDLLAYCPYGLMVSRPYLYNKNGRTLLDTACEGNQVHVVDFLLQQEAFKTDCDLLVDAFFRAIKNGSADCVARLLQNRECRVNMINRQGVTPLIQACMEGRANCVRVLTSNPECDVNKVEDGMTSLSVAISKGHSECVDVLMEHPDSKGVESLIVAAENNHVDCLKLLLQNPDCPINEFDRHHFTSLQVACQKGNVECVILLLQHQKCDVNARSGGDLKTALMYAAEKQIDCMNLLLERPECDVNAQDYEGETALHMACFWTDAQCVECLLQHKDINIHLKSKKDKCALEEAYGNSTIHELFKKYFPDN